MKKLSIGLLTGIMTGCNDSRGWSDEFCQNRLNYYESCIDSPSCQLNAKELNAYKRAEKKCLS